MNPGDHPATFASESAPPRGHRPTPVVGLTGGVGAGKSWLAAALADRGAALIDADRVGHEVLDEPEVGSAVLDRFGPTVATADRPPRVDRRALGSVVFADRDRLAELEQIVHPRMRERFVRRIDELRRSDRPPPLIVLDAAVLLEAGWDDLCDLVVLVDTPEAVRHARLRDHRGWDDREIGRREAAQWPLDRKRSRADLILSGTADPAGVEPAVARIVAGLEGTSLAPSLADRHQPDPPRAGGP